MRNTKSVYIEIFDYYGIKNTPMYGSKKIEFEKKKQTIRKYIREQLRKSFPDYDWSDPSIWYEKLSEDDRNIFKLITIKDYMIAALNLSENEETKFRKKIDNDVKSTYAEASNKARKINALTDKMNKQYFDPTASESDQRNAYEEFCSQIEGKTFFKPTFEEWKSYPMTPYEYIRKSANDASEELDMTPYMFIPSEAQIDHVILRTLLKYIEENHSIKVDIESITKCLTDINQESFERREIEAMRTSFSYIEPFKYTEDNLDFLVSKERLEQLNFIKDRNDKE